MSDNHWTFADEEPAQIKKKTFTNKKALITVGIVAVLLLAATIGLSVWCSQLNYTVQVQAKDIESLNNRIKFKDEEIEHQRSSATEYQDKYNNLLSDYNFYYSHAACVNENSNYYHKYDCNKFDSSYFWIYNTEAAELKGYSPCPYCWK